MLQKSSGEKLEVQKSSNNKHFQKFILIKAGNKVKVLSFITKKALSLIVERAYDWEGEYKLDWINDEDLDSDFRN